MKKWLCLLLPLSGVFLLNFAAPASVEKNGCIVHYIKDLNKLSRDYYGMQERKKEKVTYKKVTPYQVFSTEGDLVDYNLNFRGISQADCNKMGGDFYQLSKNVTLPASGCSLFIKPEGSSSLDADLKGGAYGSLVTGKFVSSGKRLSLFNETCDKVMASLKAAGISFNAEGADNDISFYDFATFVPEKLAPAAKVLGGSSY